MAFRWTYFFLLLAPQVGHAADLANLNDGNITVQRTSSDSFSLKVKSTFPVIKTVKEYQKEFVSIELDGFSDDVEPGFYNIPRKIIHVVVPDNKDLVLAAKSHKDMVSVSLEHDIEVAREKVHHSDSFHVRSSSRSAQKNYGEKLAVVEDISYAGSSRLATISIWPVSYSLSSRSLGHVSDFEVKFSFVAGQGSASTPPVSSANNAFLAPLVVNDWDLPQGSDTRLDLIIAHEFYRDAIAPFIEFKKSQGRDVRLLFVQNNSASSIKSMIAAEYRKSPAPSSTLLIGNIDQIPSWRGTGDNAWTDYPYQTLDSGAVPDIALGRVPAHNVSELSAFFAKAISRENSPPNISDILLTAGRDVRLGCPDNVSKVGDHIKSGDSNINLIKKFRSRGASKDEIFDAYNAGPNIVVYDGHGDHTGMIEIPMVLNNLSQLTNSVYAIVFDIACLNANWSRGASRRNFAEMILLKKDYGVAGIMASGGSGNGHTFFQTIGKLAATARKDLSSGQASTLNEVGTLILSAKIKHGSQDRSYWNYYGDPATSVWPN